MTPIQSLSRHASNPSFVAVLASVACISSFFDSSKNNAQDSTTLCEEVHRTNILSSSTINKPMILASSPISNGNKLSNEKLLEEKKKKKDTIIVADYIIIGYGKAGQSALRTIKELDPTTHIVIIDPSNNYLQQQSSDNDHSSKSKRGILNRNNGSEIHLYTRANYIDHSNKLINIHPTNNNDTTTQSIRYKKSVLIATGSRAAPPPESCVRQDAKDRILELRSTSSIRIRWSLRLLLSLSRSQRPKFLL